MEVLDSNVVYSCPVFFVTEDTLVEPSGHLCRRSIVRHAASAVVFAVDEQERILLVRQFRLAVRESIWELPAGKVDEGESALEAAKRELKEETGCTGKDWRPLVTFQPSPGYVSEEMVLFLATGLTQGEAEPMEDEDIESRWWTADELAGAIESGEIYDGKTMIGYWAWRNGAVQSGRENAR